MIGIVAGSSAHYNTHAAEDPYHVPSNLNNCPMFHTVSDLCSSMGEHLSQIAKLFRENIGRMPLRPARGFGISSDDLVRRLVNGQSLCRGRVDEPFLMILCRGLILEEGPLALGQFAISGPMGDADDVPGTLINQLGFSLNEAIQKDAHDVRVSAFHLA